MSVVNSPNMNLPVPVVGQEFGPQWATDVNNCFAGVDSHDHSAGKGVQVTPAGININSDLSFNKTNNATFVRTVRYWPNPTLGASDLGASYVNGVDLYFVDGNGNQVRLTQAGAVAGTSGSIANLVAPASATFVGGSSTFVWQSAANTPANLDAGFIILRNNIANSKGLTLQPPAAMGADYAITLPALPGATNFVTMDPSGNLAAAANVDNSTLQFVGNTLSVKNQGITAAKLAPLGQQISSSCGAAVTVVGTTQTAITNLTVTITTSGRPVYIGLISDGSGTPADFGIGDTGATGAIGVVVIVRGVTNVSVNRLITVAGVAGIGFKATYVPSSLNYIDPVGAGTYTYTVAAYGNTGTTFVGFDNCKLIAYEI